jgi:hypothetical protein
MLSQGDDPCKSCSWSRYMSSFHKPKTQSAPVSAKCQRHRMKVMCCCMEQTARLGINGACVCSTAVEYQHSACTTSSAISGFSKDSQNFL